MSLEAHGRYISSLIQKESMEGRQLPLQAQEALEAVAKQGGSGEPTPLFKTASWPLSVFASARAKSAL